MTEQGPRRSGHLTAVVTLIAAVLTAGARPATPASPMAWGSLWNHLHTPTGGPAYYWAHVDRLIAGWASAVLGSERAHLGLAAVSLALIGSAALYLGRSLRDQGAPGGAAISAVVLFGLGSASTSTSLAFVAAALVCGSLLRAPQRNAPPPVLPAAVLAVAGCLLVARPGLAGASVLAGVASGLALTDRAGWRAAFQYLAQLLGWTLALSAWWVLPAGHAALTGAFGTVVDTPLVLRPGPWLLLAVLAAAAPVLLRQRVAAGAGVGLCALGAGFALLSRSADAGAVIFAVPGVALASVSLSRAGALTRHAAARTAIGLGAVAVVILVALPAASGVDRDEEADGGFPAAVEAHLDASTRPGKVAVLPTDERPESTLGTVAGRAVLDVTDRAMHSGATDLLRVAEAAIAAGDGPAASRAMNALGATFLVIDEHPGGAGRGPKELLRNISLVPGLNLVARQGDVSLFELVTAPGELAMYRGVLVSEGDGQALVAAAAPRDVAVSDAATMPDGVAWALTGPGQIRTSAGAFEVSRLGRGQPVFTPFVQSNQLILRTPQAAFVGRQPVGPAFHEVVVATSRAATAFTVGAVGAGVSATSFVNVDHGDVVTAYGPVEGGRLGAFGTASSCSDDVTAEEGGHELERDGEVLRLLSVRGAACVTAPVDGLGEHRHLRLALDLRTTSGAPARLCLFQHGPGGCAPVGLPEPSGVWQRVDTVVAVAEGTTAVTLYLYADGDEPETVVEYRDPLVEVVEEVGRTRAEVVPVGPVAVELTRDEHVVIPGGAGPAALGPAGAVERCPDGMTGRGPCAMAPIVGFSASTVFRLSLEVLGERDAAVCVWEVGPNRCATLPALPNGPGWHPYNVQYTPAATATGVWVYLRSSDADAFRVVTTEPLAPSAAVVRSAIDESDLPALAWRADGTATYQAHIQHIRNRFVLGLADAFDPGWDLVGLPAGSLVEHVRLDGYANGWVVTVPEGVTGVSVQLRWAPAGTHRILARIGLLVAVGAAMAAVPTVRRRRRVPGR